MQNNMITKKFLPVWYGGDIGNNRNALCSVGHLSYTGFLIPKCKKNEYQKPFTRNPIEVNRIFKQFY